MSVGGKVLQTRIVDGGIDIDVYDPPYGDESTVGVVDNDDSRSIKVGDSVWWHGRSVYWTPEPNRQFSDRKIARVGYSHNIQKLN